MNKVYVNIACGNSFVEDWLNFDYVSMSKSVIKADLLGRLPLADESVDVLYSSHFIEHVPKSQVPAFLKECFRVLKPGGKIRFVCPDLEEISREYLFRRQAGEHDKADFVLLEMLDQCVRMTRGGELGAYYNKLDANPQMANYVAERTGECIAPKGGSFPAAPKRQSVLKNPRKIWYRLEWIWFNWLSSLMPKAFRMQNVSYADVGERHAWIYDFYTLGQLLKNAGFESISKLSHCESNINGFPLYPLDVKEDGSPRKGRESMYIEGDKL